MLYADDTIIFLTTNMSTKNPLMLLMDIVNYGNKVNYKKKYYIQ